MGLDEDNEREQAAREYMIENLERLALTQFDGVLCGEDCTDEIVDLMKKADPKFQKVVDAMTVERAQKSTPFGYFILAIVNSAWVFMMTRFPHFGEALNRESQEEIPVVGISETSYRAFLHLVLCIAVHLGMSWARGELGDWESRFVDPTIKWAVADEKDGGDND